MSDAHRFFHRQAADGNEGDDIHRAHAGMLSRVGAHVDELHSLAGGLQSRLFDGLRLPDECNHGAIMIGVGEIVEELDAGGSPDLRDDLLHFLVVPAFAKIRHAFQKFHFNSFLPQRAQRTPRKIIQKTNIKNPNHQRNSNDKELRIFLFHPTIWFFCILIFY
jgi:hypothetical protein